MFYLQYSLQKDVRTWKRFPDRVVTYVSTWITYICK
jgi:hypothetical protein